MLVPSSAQARPAPHPGGAHAAGLVRRWRGCAGQAAVAVHLSRPRGAVLDVLVPLGRAGAHGHGRGAPGNHPRGTAMSLLAPTLEAFFTERLLLRFAAAATGKPPSQLEIDDLDARVIGRFLEDLERNRHNSVRTRNARLAAIHSLFRYAALRHPEHADVIQRVLTIPHKRFDRALVCFLYPRGDRGPARRPQSRQ